MNIKILKELRDFLYSEEYKKHGSFDMENYLICGVERKCYYCLAGFLRYIFKIEHERDVIGGCSGGDPLWDFLFSEEWKKYDNTVEGAIGRLDAVIDGLRF